MRPETHSVDGLGSDVHSQILLRGAAQVLQLCQVRGELGTGAGAQLAPEADVERGWARRDAPVVRAQLCKTWKRTGWSDSVAEWESVIL